MPYVRRDDSGQLVAVFATEQEDASELMVADSPELLAFLSLDEAGREALASLTATDLELVRVLEDLIGLLIDKNVIQPTELPQEAAAKLFRRRQLRGELDSLAGLVADEDQTF